MDIANPNLRNIQTCLHLAERAGTKLYFSIQVQTADTAIRVVKKDSGAEKFGTHIDYIFSSLQPEVIYVSLYDSLSPRAEKTAKQFIIYCHDNRMTTLIPETRPQTLNGLGSLGETLEAHTRLDMECQYLRQHVQDLQETIAEQDDLIDRMKQYIRRLKQRLKATQEELEAKPAKGSLGSLVSDINSMGIDLSGLVQQVLLTLVSSRQQQAASPQMPHSARTAAPPPTQARRNAFFTPES